MSVIEETSHVPMAGEHAPTDEVPRQSFTPATRSSLVVYTRTADER